MGTSSPQEALWLLRAQSGDRTALERLLLAVQSQLYGYLVTLVRDEHLAMDLLQDVFLIVIQKVRWLRDPHAFQAWVYRIASREAFRALKKKRRLTDFHEPDACLEAVAADDPVEELAAEVIDRIPALLGEVSPASRVVLYLHYRLEMTLREVADVLEIPLGTAKARLAYGIRVLRKRLNEVAARHGEPQAPRRR